MDRDGKPTFNINFHGPVGSYQYIENFGTLNQFKDGEYVDAVLTGGQSPCESGKCGVRSVCRRSGHSPLFRRQRLEYVVLMVNLHRAHRGTSLPL